MEMLFAEYYKKVGASSFKREVNLIKLYKDSNLIQTIQMGRPSMDSYDEKMMLVTDFEVGDSMFSVKENGHQGYDWLWHTKVAFRLG